MMIYLYDRVEKIVGKETTGYQHFLLFLQCFQKALFFQGREKTGLCDE